MKVQNHGNNITCLILTRKCRLNSSASMLTSDWADFPWDRNKPLKEINGIKPSW